MLQAGGRSQSDAPPLPAGAGAAGRGVARDVARSGGAGVAERRNREFPVRFGNGGGG